MEKSFAVAALSALAQETRLEVFRLLVEQGPDGLPAGVIGERLKLPAPTLSFHLNQLRHAGLIGSRRESRSIIYAANFNAMTALVGYLTENCCRGQPERCLPMVNPAACVPVKRNGKHARA
ncbi:MAG: helix-turn-helix transcriptional regulator [Candidatus Binataceae bacterium]|nr:helix-turn-helix transcriptional regulator [Candidatus Binataceae bacterium]